MVRLTAKNVVNVHLDVIVQLYVMSHKHMKQLLRLSPGLDAGHTVPAN